MSEKPWRAAPAAAILSLALSACGSLNGSQDDKLGNFLVAPGKYQLFDCQQLTQQSVGYVSRERELREVMAKAEAAPAGGLISAVAYRSEYSYVQGNIDELRREVVAKKCDPPPPGLMPEVYAPAIGRGTRR